MKPLRSRWADFCAMHYHRQYRHGDVNKTAVERPAKYVRKYKSGMARNHPLAPPSGRVYVHRRVLYDKIGPGEHACYWGCGRILHWTVGQAAGDDNRLVADHLDGQGDNNDPANLVPSCHHCNVFRDDPKRVAELRAAGWWSRNDTVSRLRSGGRKCESNGRARA